MIDEAKRKAAAANGTARDTMDRLNDIRSELDKINVPSGGSNLGGVLDDVDKTGEFSNKCVEAYHCFFWQNNQLHYLVPAVKNLLNTIPSLNDKISEVENLTSQFSPVSNITENIKKIKELIEQARDAANRVRSHSLNTCTHTYAICPPWV